MKFTVQKLQELPCRKMEPPQCHFFHFLPEQYMIHVHRHTLDIEVCKHLCHKLDNVMDRSEKKLSKLIWSLQSNHEEFLFFNIIIGRLVIMMTYLVLL